MAKALETARARYRLIKAKFKQQARLLREAVWEIAGLKVDLCDHEGERVRVRSMFAEQETDQLMFQRHSRGQGETTYQLLETEFAKGLDPQITNFLSMTNSIPMFLCEVQRDLFEEQTTI